MKKFLSVISIFLVWFLVQSVFATTSPTTPNYNLYLPYHLWGENGETPYWDTLYNDNFTAIDSILTTFAATRGWRTLADCSGVTGIGFGCVNSATGTICFGNGTACVPPPGTGVPYTGALQDVDLNGKNLKDVASVSSASIYVPVSTPTPSSNVFGLTTQANVITVTGPCTIDLTSAHTTWQSSGIEDKKRLKIFNGGLNVTWTGVSWKGTASSITPPSLVSSGDNYIVFISLDGGVTVEGIQAW